MTLVTDNPNFDGRLTRLETVLFGNGSKGCRGKQEHHDMRIRKLEIGQARLVLIAGTISGLTGGVVVAIAVKLLGG